MGLTKGKRFRAPDGRGGYTLTRDLRFGDPIMVDTFRAFGGQPVPKALMPMPSWLGVALSIEAYKLTQPAAPEAVSPSSNSTGD